MHTYSGDNSFRCFHINLNEVVNEDYKSLKLEFIASSGSALLGYMGYVEDIEKDDIKIKEMGAHPTFTINLSPLLHNEDVKFFYPFTTTLIEVILNREPLPVKEINKVTWFLEEKIKKLI